MFGTPLESKLKQSKDMGLRPLLNTIADWINTYLIWPLDPYFELEFVGLDAKSADQEVELGKKETSFKKTVDEIRAEDDLAPLPDGRRRHGLDGDDLVQKVRDFRPEVVGVSCLFSAQSPAAHHVCRLVRQADPGVMTVIGGAHPSAVPQEVLADPSVDVAATGVVNVIAGPASNVNLGSEETIEIDQVSAGGKVRIKVQRGLYDGRTDTGDPVNIRSGDLILEAEPPKPECRGTLGRACHRAACLVHLRES